MAGLAGEETGVGREQDEAVTVKTPDKSITQVFIPCFFNVIGNVGCSEVLPGHKLIFTEASGADSQASPT